ncbi:hypothetical protein MNBD_BACTEROID03-1403 [hydrothermal vent metagenome]|uniref:Transposase IS66 central domain-containing protein n=1 Tax=hydrothermal vent metagenome TaxID=652676 RepID=A0A3B0T9S3_9ZZZZ
MNSLEELVSRIGKLEKRVVELERENSILRERLLTYEKPKNSRNSSIPPSKAAPAYQLIKERVAAEKVVGTDETGIRINGNLNWFWTWQSKLATYIVFSQNRGDATIKMNFPSGFQDAVLVSDC